MGGGAAPTPSPAVAVTRRLGPVCSRCSAGLSRTPTHGSLCALSLLSSGQLGSNSPQHPVPPVRASLFGLTVTLLSSFTYCERAREMN